MDDANERNPRASSNVNASDQGRVAAPAPGHVHGSWRIRFTMPPELHRVAWRPVLLMTSTVAALVTLVVFLIPPTYEATATFIPVRDPWRVESSLEPSALAAAGLGALSSDQPTLAYPEILRSRTVIETVLTVPIRHPTSGRPVVYLEHMGIGAEHPGRRLDRAIRKLRKQSRILFDRRSGVVSVTLEGRDPAMISAVVNRMVTELQRYNVESRSHVAGETRRFIEQERTETEARLAGAERELKGFRERNLRIGNSPQLLLEQERLVRNVRAQEEIYLTLVRQQELSKIEEHRSTPVLSVLDPAQPPPFKSRPRRMLLIALWTIGAFTTTATLSIWSASGLQTRRP